MTISVRKTSGALIILIGPWLARFAVRKMPQLMTPERNRARFFAEYNAAYAALRDDPEAWREELRERDLWDRTSGDGVVTSGGAVVKA